MNVPKIERIVTSYFMPIIRPTSAALFRWHWFWRFLGRERPEPVLHVYVHSGVAYVSPHVYDPGPKKLLVRDFSPADPAIIQGLADRLKGEFPCH